MKIFTGAILFFFCTLLVLSCSKGSSGDDSNGGGGHINNPSDTTAPVLTISAPIADQVYSGGSTISITGRITDDLGLYRGSIRVVNDATSIVEKEQLYEIHGLLGYNFGIGFLPSVSAITNYTVTVSFEDHGNNSASKSIKIKVTP